MRLPALCAVPCGCLHPWFFPSLKEVAFFLAGFLVFARAALTRSLSDTSAMGTSHQDSYPGTLWSYAVSMTTTEVRDCLRAVAQSGFQLFAGARAAVHAPRLAALASKSTGRKSPSYFSIPAIAILSAHAFVATTAAEAADAGESVIVEQDDIEFAAFLHRGDDFLRHHQVRPVADQHVDFAVRDAPFLRPGHRRFRSPCRSSRTPCDSRRADGCARVCAGLRACCRRRRS